MEVKILDAGDKCCSCNKKNVQRVQTDEGVVRQCRVCNCAWVYEESTEKDSD